MEAVPTDTSVQCVGKCWFRPKQTGGLRQSERPGIFKCNLRSVIYFLLNKHILLVSFMASAKLQRMHYPSSHGTQKFQLIRSAVREYQVAVQSQSM